MSAPFQLNGLIRLTASFTDTNKNAVDPSDVTLYLKAPGGAVQTLTYSGGQVQRDTTGAYHYDVLPTVNGKWFYRFEGEGLVEIASADTPFVVQSSILVTS